MYFKQAYKAVVSVISRVVFQICYLQTFEVSPDPNEIAATYSRHKFEVAGYVERACVKPFVFTLTLQNRMSLPLAKESFIELTRTVARFALAFIHQ